jgi:hypothetical protein
MTGGKEVLEHFIEDVNSSSSITFGDTSKGKVLGRGKLVISKDLSLENSMLVESRGYNLSSVHHLCCMGYNSYLTLHYVKVFRSDISTWFSLDMLRMAIIWLNSRKRAHLSQHV